MNSHNTLESCDGLRRAATGYSTTYHNVVPRYHNVVQISALRSEAAEASAPAAPTGAIATRPPPGIGPRVVGRLGLQAEPETPSRRPSASMDWKKSAIAPQTHQRRTRPPPGPACGTAMRRSASEVVAGMCAVGSGVSGGRRRSLGWRQGGRGDGWIRRFQGETAGWLPGPGFAVTLWLPR